MDITQEKLNELKSQIKIEESLGAMIQSSLVVGGKPESKLMADAAAPDDCQSFGFDIKILKISGSICKSGKLDIAGSIFGVELTHYTFDISGGEICYSPGLGKLIRATLCFSLRDGCLYTRGEIDGWFSTRAKWDERILCF